MTEGCTCCPIHGHESPLSLDHLRPADTPELAKANKSRDAAQARFDAARAEWEVAEVTARRLENTLTARFRYSGGPDAAPAEDRSRLADLVAEADRLATRMRAEGVRAVEARQAAAAAQHRATQLLIASW